MTWLRLKAEPGLGVTLLGSLLSDFHSFFPVFQCEVGKSMGKRKVNVELLQCGLPKEEVETAGGGDVDRRGGRKWRARGEIHPSVLLSALLSRVPARNCVDPCG